MGCAILGAVCLSRPKEPIKCRETQMHQNRRLSRGLGHGGTCWQLILSDTLDEHKPKLIGAITTTDVVLATISFYPRSSDWVNKLVKKQKKIEERIIIKSNPALALSGLRLKSIKWSIKKKKKPPT